MVGGDSYSEKELETQIQDNEDGTYEISYFPEFKRHGFNLVHGQRNIPLLNTWVFKYYKLS